MMCGVESRLVDHLSSEMSSKRTIEEVEASIEELESDKKRLVAELNSLYEKDETKRIAGSLEDLHCRPVSVVIHDKEKAICNATSRHHFDRDDWKNTVLVTVTLKNGCKLYYGICGVNPRNPELTTVYIEHPKCKGFLGKVREFEEYEYDDPKPIRDNKKVRVFHDRWHDASVLFEMELNRFEETIAEFAKTCDRVTNMFTPGKKDDAIYRKIYSRFRMVREIRVEHEWWS